MLDLFDLCSGIGGFSLAGDWTGKIRTVGFAETDPYCQKVLAHHWPGRYQFGDVKNVTDESLGNVGLSNIGIISAGFPCFVADTYILTESGYKPIQDIQVGEKVLTHKRRWQKVTAIMKRENAPLQKVSMVGLPPIITTPEHPFYARPFVNKWNNDIRQYRKAVSGTTWIESQHLSSHFVGQTIPDTQPCDYPEEFLWLIGRYLADGWTVQRKDRLRGGRVVICCSKEKSPILSDHIQKAGFHGTLVEGKSADKYHISNNDLHEFVQQFGKYAYGKKLPSWCFGLSREQTSALLDGYIAGDGYRLTNGVAITTTSKALALSVVLLAQKAYGVLASVNLKRMPATTIIEGRTVNQRNFYRVTIYDKNRTGFIENQYGWRLVKNSIQLDTTGTVYNISVECDESYVADGVIVHNCQPFSTAGAAQLGESDPRYLWPQIERIIRTVRPPYVVLENVPGLLSNDKGRVFGRILGELAACGYDAEWEVLPASAFGAWHRRDRVWLVAYPNRQRQPQPSTFSESSADHQRYTATSERIRRTKFYAVGASLEVTPHAASLRRESVSTQPRGTSESQEKGWLLQPTGDTTLASNTSEQRLQTADCIRQRGSGLTWRSPRIFRFTPERESIWTDIPDIPVLVDGLSSRTPEFREWENGVKALGNSIVPQIARWIFERILEDYQR